MRLVRWGPDRLMRFGLERAAFAILAFALVGTLHPSPVAAERVVRAGEAVPVPAKRPVRATVVGRVANGRAVPLSASAFAARAEGPIAELLARAESQARAPGEVASDAGRPAGSAGRARPLVAANNAPSRTITLAAADPDAFASAGRQTSQLEGALDALRRDRYSEALARRNGLADPLDRLVVDHFLVRSGTQKLTFAMVADYLARADGWPDAGLARTRAEEALSRERPSAAQVRETLGASAHSPVGVRLVARALLEGGERARAASLVRSLWHDRPMGTALQGAIANEFSELLTADDHLTRVDMLMGRDRHAEAKGLRARLGTGPRAYVDARLAAATGAGNASARLKAVPADLRKRAGYRLAQAETLRRADKLDEAAKLIERTPASEAKGDDWWVETRIVARMLAERGEGRRAAKLIARGGAKSLKHRADAAFHAGWYALRYLEDARAAEKHFAALEAMVSRPISKARAAHWQARAAEARRDTRAAAKHDRRAAAFGFTFYGQLSRAKLGLSGTGVDREPTPSAADRAAFQRNAVAEAVRRLIKAGHKHRIAPLLVHLGKTVPTAGQAALAAELGHKAGFAHLALKVAKEAQARGLDVGRLAYPTKAIPRSATVPADVERALVHAIARQESMFNAGAVSPAGARGLMQVMPRTASQIAKRLGLRHSAGKLNDPAYNATLGAAYLETRLGDFDGSYILTFAAYNAGAGRVREWIERFGDPRDPKVDPVAWVEDIPFPETRNYVQRVMENVQVYREALGNGRLAIGTDLRRGARG